MKKYENIGIDSNRDKFWMRINYTYSRLNLLITSMVVISIIAHKLTN